MVLVFLDNLQFEATKFETRTMPTPDLKGKELIYWIKVETRDKRLMFDLQSFLKGAPQIIELKVPSAFIVAKTELETHRVSISKVQQEDSNDQPSTNKEIAPQDNVVVAKSQSRNSGPRIDMESGEDWVPKDDPVDSRLFVIEVILRRALPPETAKQSQSPYG
ncbi:MAG: hypothetical protein ACYC7D_00180 [Nitrososphaerales archaeon]